MTHLLVINQQEPFLKSLFEWSGRTLETIDINYNPENGSLNAVLTGTRYFANGVIAGEQNFIYEIELTHPIAYAPTNQFLIWLIVKLMEKDGYHDTAIT